MALHISPIQLDQEEVLCLLNRVTLMLKVVLDAKQILTFNEPRVCLFFELFPQPGFEGIFRRLNSYSRQHSLYKTMKAFGQIIKSLFILRYIDDLELRQAVEKQLNKIELANKFTRAVAVGNPREFAQAEKEDQEIAEACNRLIKNCIRAIIAGNFISIAEKFTRLPVMRRDPHEPNTYRLYDLTIVNRLELLIEWWFASRDERFAQLCLELARNPADGFSAWREGRTLVHLVRDLRNGTHEGLPVAQELSDELEQRVILLLRGPTWADDIESIYSAIDAADDTLSNEVIVAANEAVIREVDDASDNSSSVDSESTLKDQIVALEKLAPRAGISPVKLAQAIAAIESRISEISEATEEAPAPPISGRLPWQTNTFDNAALSNLFAPLIGDAPVSSAKILPITSSVDVPF